MKYLLFISSLLLVFSCISEDPEVPCIISYEVLVVNPAEAEFTVTFRDGNGTDQIIGHTQGDYWYKGELEGFEKGDLVKLRVENHGGASQYRLRAKKNGLILDQINQQITNQVLEISVEIPNHF